MGHLYHTFILIIHASFSMSNCNLSIYDSYLYLIYHLYTPHRLTPIK